MRGNAGGTIIGKGEIEVLDKENLPQNHSLHHKFNVQ
jgi:hypothetical protein